MPMRLFQIAVVLFWLATTTWLITTIVTPDEAGMTTVDPRRPVNAFFNWGDTTRMTLMKDGTRIGELSVTGYSAEGGESPGFSISGSLNGDVPLPAMGTFVSVLVKFKEDFSPEEGNFIFRIPSRKLNVKASVTGPDEILRADVTLAGAPLFTYDGSAREAPDPAMLGMLGEDSVAGGLLASAGNPSRWKWNLESFRGMHRMAGRRFPVYLMKLSIDQFGEEIKVYFSEAGEPLKVETGGLGYIAISEVLVPIEPKPADGEIID